MEVGHAGLTAIAWVVANLVVVHQVGDHGRDIRGRRSGSNVLAIATPAGGGVVSIYTAGGNLSGNAGESVVPDQSVDRVIGTMNIVGVENALLVIRGDIRRSWIVGASGRGCRCAGWLGGWVVVGGTASAAADWRVDWRVVSVVGRCGLWSWDSVRGTTHSAVVTATATATPVAAAIAVSAAVAPSATARAATTLTTLATLAALAAIPVDPGRSPIVGAIDVGVGVNGRWVSVGWRKSRDSGCYGNIFVGGDQCTLVKWGGSCQGGAESYQDDGS